MAVINLVEDSVSSKPTAQDALALRGVFEAIYAESCPTLFNFHMHTVCSDGQLQPEALMEQAIAIGLQGFAITDHHTVDGYQRAQVWLNNYIEANPDRIGNLPHLWTELRSLLDCWKQKYTFWAMPLTSLTPPWSLTCKSTPPRCDRVCGSGDC